MTTGSAGQLVIARAPRASAAAATWNRCAARIRRLRSNVRASSSRLLAAGRGSSARPSATTRESACVPTPSATSARRSGPSDSRSSVSARVPASRYARSAAVRPCSAATRSACAASAPARNAPRIAGNGAGSWAKSSGCSAGAAAGGLVEDASSHVATAGQRSSGWPATRSTVPASAGTLSGSRSSRRVHSSTAFGSPISLANCRSAAVMLRPSRAWSRWVRVRASRRSPNWPRAAPGASRRAAASRAARAGWRGRACMAKRGTIGAARRSVNPRAGGRRRGCRSWSAWRRP